MRKYRGISVVALVAACLSAGPAWAQLNLDLGIVEADVDLDARDGLDLNTDVNVLGDDGVDLGVDANVGGGGRLVAADVDANVGGSNGLNANVDATVGGDRLVDADVDIGLGGNDDDDDDDDDNGGPGGGGDGPGGGNGGGNGPGGGNGGGIGGGNGGGGGVLAEGRTSGASCIGTDTELFGQLASINYSTRAVSNWASAGNVQFIPISLCPGLDGQLGTGLLATVAPSIPALSMALGQSSYSATDILGIVQAGTTLNVYVN
jgi:hypothetical protein